MTLRFQYQSQVENDLMRPLTDAELQEVSSLDQLSDDQIAVVAAIRPRSYISPMIYVKAVVPTADHHDVRNFIEDIERIAFGRRPPEELSEQIFYELWVGRSLRPVECVGVRLFEEMSSEQIDLARTLARANLDMAFRYLAHIARKESIARCQMLARHLAES
jgi:hypothetical protein